MSGDKYLISDQERIHFLTLTVVDWIDVFTSRSHKEVIVESLNYCTEYKRLHAPKRVLRTDSLVVNALLGQGLPSRKVLIFKNHLRP